MAILDLGIWDVIFFQRLGNFLTNYINLMETQMEML